MSAHLSFKAIGVLAFLGVALQAAPAQTSADQFEYDAKGRLTEVQRGSGVLTKYSYDNADNRSQVQVALQFNTNWLATSSSIYHATGFAETWGGWAANVSYPIAYMTYGPYTTAVPTGSRTAVWRMMIDVNSTALEDIVVGLDVYDTTAGEIIASKTVKRKDFALPMAYQIFELPFTMSAARAGHSLEFRTLYNKMAYTNVQKIGYY